MAPSQQQSRTLTTMSTSTNLGDPIHSKALQRRLKSLAKQQDQQQRKLRITRRKMPSSAVILSGKQKLLQHRVNLFRGVEKGSGGASVKTGNGGGEKTKLARRNKVRRRNAVARKRAGRED